MLRSYCSGKSGSIRRRQKSGGSRRRPWQCGTSKNTRRKTLLTGRRRRVPAPASVTVKAWSPEPTVKEVKRPTKKRALSLDNCRRLDCSSVFEIFCRVCEWGWLLCGDTRFHDTHGDTGLAANRKPIFCATFIGPRNTFGLHPEYPCELHPRLCFSFSVTQQTQWSEYLLFLLCEQRRFDGSLLNFEVNCGDLHVRKTDVCWCYQGSLRLFSYYSCPAVMFLVFMEQLKNITFISLWKMCSWVTTYLHWPCINYWSLLTSNGLIWLCYLVCNAPFYSPPPPL